MFGEHSGRPLWQARQPAGAWPFCICFPRWGAGFAWDWPSLLVFRFIGGLGIGGSSVLGPMYIAEIAPAKWRGRLVGLFQFNIVARYSVGLFVELPDWASGLRRAGLALDVGSVGNSGAVLSS